MSRLLAALGWFAAFTGAAIPAFSSFFKNLVPPLFPAFGYLMSALGAFILVLVLARQRSAERVLLRRALIVTVLAVVFLAGYLVGLHEWSVADPHDDTVRYQVGLGTSPRMLTANGKRLMSALPDASPRDLMLRDGAFEPDGPRRIWKTWSIYTAGLLLLFLYLFGFTFWTFGFATVALYMNSANIDPPMP